MTSHQSSLKGPKDQSSSSSRTSKVDSNALRLRENQRRSRLRKKEYLASLETRFRDCQRAGIEASVEVQTAAKRVVRENIRLRELLRAKGVSDTEVDGWVRETTGDGDGDVMVAPVDAAMKALARRPCTGDAVTPEESGRRKSTGMVNERSRNGGGSEFNVQTRGISEELSGRQPQQQEMTSPRSSVSSALHSPLSPARSFSALPMTPPPAVSPDPHPTSRRPSMSSSFTPLSSPGYTSGMGQLYSYHSLSSPPPSHPSPATATQFSDRFMMHQNQQQQHFIGHDTHGSVPCDVARSMIVQMATEGSVDVLTRELCPHGPLQGCVVNTGVLFGVMDRTCV